MNSIDGKLGELVGRADSREQKELQGVDRSSRDYYFLVGEC